MESDFLCPNCKSYLNIGNKIVFSIKVNTNQAGLLLLEKELGNYDVKKQDQIQYELGDIVGFYCPVCHQNLISDKHINLARMLMLDGEKQEFEIYFSRISGEQATFKVKDKIVEAFGNDQHKYRNLF